MMRRRKIGKQIRGNAHCGLPNALFAVLLACLLAAPAFAEPAPLRIGGTFLQLWAKHWDWTPDQWDTLFAGLAEAQVTHLVMQWTAYDDLRLFRSEKDGGPQGRSDPLEAVLQRADAAGMSVLVGLSHRSDYGRKIRRDPEVVRVSLKRIAIRSMEIARELHPRLRLHPSFAGWYLPEEIDDVNWREPAAREVLARHLQFQIEELRRLEPVRPVAISGFSNAQLSPGELAAFWKTLLRHAPANMLLFQDGVGVGKLPLPELDTYYEQLRAAVREVGCRFHPVVELFEARESAQGEFSAEAAEFERVRRQLERAAQFGATPLFAFSIPDYMSATGTLRAARLHKDYLREVLNKPDRGSRKF